MRRRWHIAAIGVAAAAVAGVLISAVRAVEPLRRGGKAVSVKRLEEAMARLRPLHTKLAKPKPGEWLYHHRESGQSFAAYRRCRPVIPDARRRVIYIQPLGAFTEAQRKVVKLAGEYIGLHFDLPVRFRKDLPLSVIPASARRTHPSWGDKQVLSTHVLDKLLRPKLPKDAFALIAFTSSDLWPGRGWNFVFGQASLRERVGVWSIYRFGDPAGGGEAFRLCLRRTIATGTHELGHMLSMQHCTAYECNLCGSNSLAESDGRPLALCPECMAKVCWACQIEPVARYRKLAAFCTLHGLKAEAGFFEKCLKALGATGGAGSRPAR